MKLLFFDETQDHNNKEYLGISCSYIDHIFYGKLKSLFFELLRKYSWDKSIEFKGSTIFSSNKGDLSVSIENRINLVKDLLKENVANKNSRVKFAFVKAKTKNVKIDYLDIIPKLLIKFLPKAPTGAGKNIISVFYDHRPDLCEEEFYKNVIKSINSKGYILLEGINSVNSKNEAIGIILSDIVGYFLGRIDNIKNDIDLFEDISDNRKDVKVKKLNASQDLIKIIKNIKYYKYNYDS